MQKTIKLYRPVGKKELALIADSDCRLTGLNTMNYGFQQRN